MNKVALKMKPAGTVFIALAMALISCGSALAGVINIVGPNDNYREYNGGGMVIDCSGTGETIGIELINAAVVTVHDYEVKNCDVGISITGVGGNRFFNMYVHASITDGMRLLDASRNHIYNSNVSNNHRNGINLLQGSARNKFYNMIVDGNGLDGFNCDGVTNIAAYYNVIGSSEISANGRRGFFLKTGCDFTRIRLSTIANNLAEGIYIRSNQNKINYNTITGNAAEGIKLRTYAGENVIEINTISQNGQQGIENKGDNNIFMWNTVSENHNQGIQLESGANGNFIAENWVTNNRDNDLEDLNANCDSNTWTSNLFGSANATCIH